MNEETVTEYLKKTDSLLNNTSINNRSNENIFTNESVDLLINNKNGTAANHSLSLIILDWINLYYLGGMIVIGILGNLKNFISFLKAENKLKSPSYYLASLAFADLIFLAILLILWLNQFEIDLFSHPGIYQTFFFFSSSSSCISAWLIVAFTFERLIVVRYPLQRPIICTVRRTKVIIGCLTVAVLIVQAVSLFPTGVIGINSAVKNRNATDSKAINSHHQLFSPYFYYQLKRFISMLEIFVTLVVPPALTVVMNGLIIHSLFQYNKTFRGDACSKHKVMSTATPLKTIPHQKFNIQRNTRIRLNYLQSRLTCYKKSPKDNKANQKTRLLVKREDGNMRRSFYIKKRNQLLTLSSSVKIRQSIQNVIEVTVTIENESAGMRQLGAATTVETRIIDDSAVVRQPARVLTLTDDNNSQSLNNMDVIEYDPRQAQNVQATNHVDLEMNSITNKLSSRNTENSITKKLILVSSVHILLNLPSYAMNLKIFIDDTINAKSEISLGTWILQQYSMVLYYTNFAINFMLYSTTSSTFHH